MAAASCCEGPRPAATFADLPRAHRDELLNFALVAAVSSAFFVTMAILMRPLPSRSLAARVDLPESSPSRAVALDTSRDGTPPEPTAVAAPRSRAARPRYQLTAFQSPAASGAPATRRPRRGSVFSRFLRGILGRPSPAPALKSDPTT